MRTPITRLDRKAEIILSPAQTKLISDAWRLIRFLMRDERLRIVEMNRRLGKKPSNLYFETIFGSDIRLSKLAEIMHAMGKRVKLVVEDEV